MRDTIHKLPGGAVALVGFESEAYASVLVAGAKEGEDGASPRSLRKAARHLRDVTGRPFRAFIPSDDVENQPGQREPTSSPRRPIWAVRSDCSLDPCAAPNDDYMVGVEVITPPLDFADASGAVRHSAGMMSGPAILPLDLKAAYRSTCRLRVSRRQMPRYGRCWTRSEVRRRRASKGSPSRFSMRPWPICLPRIRGRRAWKMSSWPWSGALADVT